MPSINLPDLADLSREHREHAKTNEFAHLIRKADQTVRKNYCLHGHCYGIRPIKVGNNLLWPVAQIADLLAKGEA